MPVLYNFGTKKVEKVDDENVQSLVSSGNYGFRKGVQIPAITPDGQKVYLAPEEVSQAFNAGYTYETPQLTKQIAAHDIAASKAEAFDSPITAAIAGGLRGATLGLSDVAGAAVGLGEELSDLKAINPGASLTGEITGGILGTVASLTPVGAVAKGAGLAAKAVANPITKAIIAPTIEGAAQGVANVVSQAALSDPDLNMTHAIQEIGLGGVLGAGFGAVGKGVSYSWDKLKSAAASLKMGDKVNKSLAQVTNLIKNVAPEDKQSVIEAFTNKSDLTYQALTNPKKVTELAADSFQQLDDVNRQLDSLSMGLRKEFRDQLEDVVTPQISNSVSQISGKMQSVINKMENRPALYEPKFLEVLKEFKNQIDNTMSSTKEKVLTTKGKVPEFFGEGSIIPEDIVDVIKPTLSQGQVHELINNTRTQLDQYLRFGLEVSKGSAKATEELMQDVRSMMQEHLRNTKLYGEFGDAYNDINKAYSFSKNIQDEFKKSFKSEVVDLSGVKKYVIDNNKIDLFMRNPEAMRNFKKDAILSNAEQIPKVYTDLLNKYVRDPELAQTLLADTNALTKGLDDLKDSRTLAVLMNSLESKTGRSLAGMAIGASVGGISAGPVGAAAGFLLGNPVTTFKYIKALEKNGLSGQKKLVDSVNSFVGKSTIPNSFKGIKNVTTKELIKAFNTDDDKSEDYSTDKLKSVLDSTMNNIEPILNKIDRYNPRMNEDFEDHYVALANMSQQAASFLNSKLPAKSQNALFPTKIRMTKSEEQRFNAYATATMYPETFLKEIASGRAKPETIEAIQSVYPRFYEEVRSEMFNAVVDNNNVPYQRKMQMAKIFNMPTTVALEHLQSLQDQYLSEPVKPNGGNMKSMAQSAETSLQSIQA